MIGVLWLHCNFGVYCWQLKKNIFGLCTNLNKMWIYLSNGCTVCNVMPRYIIHYTVNYCRQILTNSKHLFTFLEVHIEPPEKKLNYQLCLMFFFMTVISVFGKPSVISSVSLPSVSLSIPVSLSFPVSITLSVSFFFPISLSINTSSSVSFSLPVSLLCVFVSFILSVYVFFSIPFPLTSIPISESVHLICSVLWIPEVLSQSVPSASWRSFCGILLVCRVLFLLLHSDRRGCWRLSPCLMFPFL